MPVSPVRRALTTSSTPCLVLGVTVILGGMTVGQSKVFMAIFAVFALIGLLQIAFGTGNGWVFIVIGFVNVFIGYVSYKKAQRSL